MFVALGLLGALVLSQDASDRAADRAAVAAERAAKAAERAADAAERSAALAEKTIAASVAAAAPAAPIAPPVASPVLAPNPWTLSAGVGLISITGNARAITLTAQAAAKRKSEKWLLTLIANGSYGQSQPVGDAGGVAQILALSALFSAQSDYRFNESLSAYVTGGVDTDHVKSVEIRGFGEIGIGVIWLNHKEGDFQKVFLNTDLGFRYQRENRFQYFPVLMDVPDVDLVAPRAAGSFRYALNKLVIFTQDLEVLPNILGESRVLVNTNTKISAQLIAALSIGVSFAVKYDSRPAAGRVPTDTALTVGFDAAL